MAADEQARKQLGAVIRQKGQAFRDADEERRFRNEAELIRVLARLVEGASLHGAFGAPGDWGYDTDIGQALYRLYSVPGQT